MGCSSSFAAGRFTSSKADLAAVAASWKVTMIPLHLRATCTDRLPLSKRVVQNDPATCTERGDLYRLLRATCPDPASCTERSRELYRTRRELYNSAWRWRSQALSLPESSTDSPERFDQIRGPRGGAANAARLLAGRPAPQRPPGPAPVQALARESRPHAGGIAAFTEARVCTSSLRTHG